MATPSGFPAHLQAQLNQAAHQVSNSQRSRGRGRGRGGVNQRGVHGQSPWPNSQNIHPQLHHQPLHYQQQQQRFPIQDDHSFPPLGSSRPVQTYNPVSTAPTAYVPTAQSSYHPNIAPSHPQPASSPQQQQFTRPYQNQHTQTQQLGTGTAGAGPPSQGIIIHPHANGQPAPNTFQQSPRGARHQRGSQRGRYQPMSTTSHGNVDHSRTAQPGRLYNPNASQYHGTAEQQRFHRQRTIAQSDFLSKVAQQALKNRIQTSELQEKEAFRKELQQLIQNRLVSIRESLVPEHVKLKCYGSLANGFGLSGCDMDLLLVFAPESNIKEEDDFYIDSQRIIEKALLDRGYGARLLTNTRVPILRVCQRPAPELLHNLRICREEWDESHKDIALEASALLFPPDPTSEDVEVIQKLLAEWNSSEIPLPDSPTLNPVSLEFGKSCGIQCDVNFSNFVALENSRLLKAYCKIDPRVGELGVFIKYWAKTRDINTPYHGTLSSYGYILMVLHYLMNIVDPPIIPNLQLLAKADSNWNEPRNIADPSGFDTRFLSEGERLATILQSQPRNHESIGQLIRGFFWYYATHDGFNWTQEVLSLRTQGGILTKRVKGWTGAKWAENSESRNIRLRYLLAIEDPFEIDHNVGRTVGHSGIVAIRDEFRRAWGIICKVVPGKNPSVMDFLEPILDRGDTLRQDHLARKQQIFEMRQQAEKAEKELKEQNKFEKSNRGRSAHANVAEDSKATSPPLLTVSPPQDLQKPKRRKRKPKGKKSDSNQEVKDGVDSNAGEPSVGLASAAVKDTAESGATGKTVLHTRDPNAMLRGGLKARNEKGDESSSSRKAETEQGNSRGRFKRETARKQRFTDPEKEAMREVGGGEDATQAESSGRSPQQNLQERQRTFQPENWAVQFDPQQLKDIQIIMNGGNGCARSGQQYLVEQDYELGGGGLMGFKAKTETENVSSEHGQSGAGDELGRGDEEGLLQHLPGL